MQKFLSKSRVPDSDKEFGKKSIKYRSGYTFFCQRCLVPFYSKKKLDYHLDTSCNGSYFRELVPHNIPNSSEYAEFTKHNATQRAKILVVCYSFWDSFLLSVLNLKHSINSSEIASLNFQNSDVWIFENFRFRILKFRNLNFKNFGIPKKVVCNFQRIVETPNCCYS